VGSEQLLVAGDGFPTFTERRLLVGILPWQDPEVTICTVVLALARVEANDNAITCGEG